MQVVVLLLLVVALAFLVLGLIAGSTPLVIASTVASLAAIYAIVRARRRREGAPASAGGSAVPAAARSASAESAAATNAAAARVVPAVAALPDAVAPDAVAPAAVAPPMSGRPVTAEPAAGEPPVGYDLVAADADDPAPAGTTAPLDTHPGEPVWVIDGRPRYHSFSCGFIPGRGAEAVPLRQAVEDGFTPCTLCDPDSQLAAPARGS